MSALQFLAIPFHDWRKCEREGFRTRDAHLIQELGRHPRVARLLVLNRPISLAEIVGLRRSWRVSQGRVLAQHRGVWLTQVAEKTYTLDVLIPELVRPLLLRRNWIPYAFGRTRVARAVDSALCWLDPVATPVVFASHPLCAPLVPRLATRGFILDAQDDLRKHPIYRAVRGLSEYYRACQDMAILLYTNSEENWRWLKERRPDTIYLPQGIDTRVFDWKQQHPRPADLSRIARPVIGYAGKMQELVDVDLVLAASAALPDVQFVFIGQKLNRRWVARLWRRPNIHYLGDKHYSELPGYLAHFDVCTIPYSVFHQHGGECLKLYEYVAMGKPVVTTDIGGVRRVAHLPQVRIVSGADQYVAAVRELIEMANQGRVLPVDLPSELSWTARVDRIVSDLVGKLARYSDPPLRPTITQGSS